MTEMMTNTAPTEHADRIAEMLGDRDRYARKAERLAEQGREAEAEDARETADFIAREVSEDIDPERLRAELATCERMAGSVGDGEAAGRWQRRADRIRNLVARCEGDDAHPRARSAAFDFVRPIMGGFEGESALDD